MLASIHEDLPEAMNIAFEEKVHVGCILDDSPRIRRDARDPGGQTIRLRIVLRLTLIHERLRSGEQRDGFAGSQALGQIAHRATTLPDAGEIRVSIGEARSWTVRRGIARTHPLGVRIRAASRRRG